MNSNGDIQDRYKEQMVHLIHDIRPQMAMYDIRKAIDYSVEKRKNDLKCKVKNNYTHDEFIIPAEELVNWIEEKQPICTAYGVMFRKHGKREHPLLGLMRSFMEGRDIHKGMMFKALEAHQYDEVAMYNLMQLLDKRDGNSIYGCLGNTSCLLYNLHVAASITMQGRASIATATMFFESFLADNVKFGSLEETVDFIYKVKSEIQNRKFNDDMVLDRNITREEVFAKIIKNCADWRKGRIRWIPTVKDATIIWNIICKLDQQDLNRVFYKNNLYAFIANSSIINGIIYILKALEKPYLAPNEVPEEIQVELDALQDLFREYVFYSHMWIDRIDRCNNMIKDVCVISDTDSTIVSFDAFYHFILDRIMGTKLKICEMEIGDIDKYIKGHKEELHFVPKVELRYDFYNDEVIEKESMIKPFALIPQNNLRFSIINIIAYISGNLCNEYIEYFTKCNHSWSPDRKCLLYLKNEFLFSRSLLTPNKKNYATNREIQEGKQIEQTIDHSLDIKGMPINKSTLNPAIKKELKQILYDEVLTNKNIDSMRIIEKIAILEKKIEQSLKDGERDYYKPATIKAMSSYEDPMKIQGIKGAVLWNRLKAPEEETIDLNARNTVDIVKVDISPYNIDRIRDTYPDTYERFVDLFSDQNLSNVIKGGITALAIPTGITVPKWITEFIDYKTIITDSIVNFPFKSCGIPRMGASNITYSTIMKL